ncbi:MAG TPA: M20/M25/M40 family metallo-hydrolase, partial [Solirubrobacteraceae bacterium]|nr:M20/M25/M40 family metallo-hydrolase [Solirubrobacteraceae bacterium]
TAQPEGIRRGMAFVKGWLEARDLRVSEQSHNGLPVVIAQTGAPAGQGAPHVILHGHVDVVPAPPEQFAARVDGDRLIGRGAYDMKGALGAMMCAAQELAGQERVRITLVCVPDEEAEDVEQRATDVLVAGGLRGDFAITGEPTELRVGVQAKGVLAVRLAVAGRAAHGSTPWLGDNAILKAVDAYRQIETLPFSRESSELFDRPSINLARIEGGDAFNKVPDACEMVVDIRYLPGQEPEAILGQIQAIPDLRVVRTFTREPAQLSPRNPYVVALCDALRRQLGGGARDVLSVGRDGASDAISFLRAGVPAVEFGPVGGGHHGPAEWVSLRSLSRYRAALVAFVLALPSALDRPGAPELRAIEGGLA